MPGGVCAVLDYDVDIMGEYVAEMATRLVMNHNRAVPSFRKFVSQILTSTRLPSTTILLGMNYLAKRINMLKVAGDEEHVGNDGQIWRLLTVALLLGSKFLDDNTFQNRSWSEVSGLPVSELNSLESSWLRDIGWNLYVNMDESKDYNAWLKSWKDWKDTKKRNTQRERLQSLAPIDTDVSRRNSHGSGWAQQGDYERMSRLKREYSQPHAYRSRDTWQQNNFQPQQNPWHHPLTPPDSAYGTPEYENSATSSTARYNDWFAQAAATTNNISQPFQPSSNNQSGYQSSHQSSRTNSHYGSYYAGNAHYNSHGVWETGLADCSCLSCIPNKQQSYFMSHHHSYSQSVAG